MDLNAVQIRLSRDHDRDAILAVHRSAFGDDEGPLIASLVEEMLDDPTGEPILSLVAELDASVYCSYRNWFGAQTAKSRTRS